MLETQLTVKLRRTKNRLYETGNPVWKFFAKLLHVKQKLHKYRKEYSQQEINNAINNSRLWYQNLKTLTQPNAASDYPTDIYIYIYIYVYIDKEWKTPKEFTNHLMEHYRSIPDTTNITYPFTHQEKEQELQALTPGEVKWALQNINTCKATHSRDFPSWISRNNADDICIPMTDIINSVLKPIYFPIKRKQAEIKPLEKVFCPEIAKDYRPISLRWHLGKELSHFWFVISRKIFLISYLVTNMPMDQA